MKNDLLLFFEQIEPQHERLVGGKAASLGRLSRLGHNIKVPPGFVLTTKVFERFLSITGIGKEVKSIFDSVDPRDLVGLEHAEREIKGLFALAKFPSELEDMILTSYKQLCKNSNEALVAVRSSGTGEDSLKASFAGQFDTFLCVKGEKALIERVRDCFAGLYSQNAISYRKSRGYLTNEDMLLGVIIQTMVRSDKGSSGIMFSIDTETGNDNFVYITSIWGFGELIVGGKVNPDQFYVFKPTLQTHNPIIDKIMGEKQHQQIFDPETTGKNVLTIQTPPEYKMRFSITDKDILQLARWTVVIEREYGVPVDIEWAKDGKDGDGQLFIVQARPETVHSVKTKQNVIEVFELDQEPTDDLVICLGERVGTKIGSGIAKIIFDPNPHGFNKGDVLVTKVTDPDWEPIMKIASAIVTEKGGRTCHAAIVSRELGIPCVIGTGNATKRIVTGQAITVDCSSDKGRVLKGKLPFHCNLIKVGDLQRTKTKIMMNVGTPEMALTYARIPNDGVGLAREEFIITSHIGIHPKALIEFEDLKIRSLDNKECAEIVRKIEERTITYTDKTHFFVDKLASGVAKIAAAFWPNDVILRLSDFKSSEYAGLIGGTLYEPEESNPMIGWRGASRYYDPKYKAAFGLECQAIQKARDEMGLKNIKVMVPFCRTPAEGKKVIQTMAEFGLKQGENGLEIYVMCEIPSNVILAEEFAEIFDGFSIGSNDLTQLTLGLDRDSELIAHIYDERNEAVKLLIKQVIDAVHKKGRKIGICGQAPSDFPDFTEFLVECGIDSISLNPDTVIKTRLLVAQKEKVLIN